MAYQSSRQQNSNTDDNQYHSLDAASQKKAEQEEASKKTLKTAAKGAGAYFGGAVGAKAVDVIANTKAGDKILNQGAKTLNRMPGMGKAAKKLNDSGAVDAVDKGIDLVGGKGVGGAASGASSTNAISGGGQGSSLPSSSGTKALGDTSSGGGLSSLPKSSSSSNNSSNNNDSDDKKKKDSFGMFSGNALIKAAVFTFFPFLIIILLIFIAIASVSGLFSEYEDAFGISQTTGEETGNLFFQAASTEQQEFYDRVNTVKLSYQAMGKNVDALKVVAVYHILTTNGADLDYNKMTEWVIMNIADCMFDSTNSYDEETFKNNLINTLFPKYLPNSTEGEKKQMAEDVLDYIERYYSLIGKESSDSSCASTGTCTYDIKGFYFSNRGNVTKSMQISNLKVRLMECGSPYGNGSYTTAINQDLVDFEDYVAGVAYAEVGESAGEEVLKAQMVMARSFALARPTGMGNSLGKKLEQENGQWVLQISSCVADQVFCNINEGCSYMGGGDGQGGIVRSGIVSGAVRTKPALSESSPIRSAAAATIGEVLVNSQGYIISTGYVSSTQNKISSLASQGFNYKQILLQIYNTSSDIKQASCSTNSGCVSSGDYASWLQYEGSWATTQVGTSGKTIRQIGCLVTSISMLIAKSGVATNVSDFNPGTFVEYLNKNGGFDSSGNFNWNTATLAAPTFKYQGQVSLSGLTKEQKLNKIKELANQSGVYVVVEVKGNTGQHWVAVDSVNGSTINMMDPGSTSTDMWSQYNWANTSKLAYYKVG
jgi:hypothetical protein